MSVPYSRWIGRAVPQSQVETITLGGTWAAGNHAVVTINEKDLILIVGSTATTAQIAIELAKLINAASVAEAALATGYDGNYGGREILEMREFTAEAVGSTVVLVSVTKGNYFIISVDKTSVSGTITTATTTAATGPGDLANPDNWEDGAFPAEGNAIVFDTGAVDVTQNLTAFLDALSSNPFVRTTDYTGRIGLPEINAGGYREYRNRYLEMSDSTDPLSITFRKGVASPQNMLPTYISAPNTQVQTIVVEPDALPNSSAPSFELYGAIVGDVVVASGNVRFGVYGLEFAVVEITSSCTIGRPGGGTNDCRFVYENCDLASCETLVELSGEVHHRSATAHSGGGTPTWNHYGGISYIWTTSNRTGLIIRGGLVKAMTGDVGTVYIYSGAEFSRNDCSVSTSGAHVYIFAGAIYRDAADKAANVALHFPGCSQSQTTLETAQNKVFTASAGPTVT